MAASDQDSLARCLDLVLTPVIRFCIRRSIPISDLRNAAKEIFAREAKRELELSDEKVTVSRLATMTGLHRHDFQDKESLTPPKIEEASIAARVITTWEVSPRLQTKSGKPKVLSFGERDSEFTKLVESVSQAISPKTVLFQLERMGAVRTGPRGVKLLRAARTVERSLEDGFEILTQDLDNLIQAVEANLSGEESVRNLHIRSDFDHVSKKDIDRINRWLLDEGKRFQRKARQFIAKFDRDITPAKGAPLEEDERCFISIGTFSVSGIFKRMYRP